MLSTQNIRDHSLVAAIFPAMSSRPVSSQLHDGWWVLMISAQGMKKFFNGSVRLCIQTTSPKQLISCVSLSSKAEQSTEPHCLTFRYAQADSNPGGAFNPHLMASLAAVVEFPMHEVPQPPRVLKSICWSQIWKVSSGVGADQHTSAPPQAMG